LRHRRVLTDVFAGTQYSGNATRGDNPHVDCKTREVIPDTFLARTHAHLHTRTRMRVHARASPEDGEPKLVNASLSWGSLWSKLFALLDPLQPEQSHTLNLVLPPVLPLVLPFFLSPSPLFSTLSPNSLHLLFPSLPASALMPLSARVCCSLRFSVPRCPLYFCLPADFRQSFRAMATMGTRV
jgi:hypothetical protein